MKMGWKIRGFLIIILFLLLPAISYSSYSIRVKKLNDGSAITSKTYFLNIMTHEVIALEITGIFTNDSTTTDFIMSLIKDWRRELPSYIEGWKDKSITLAPLKYGELKNVIYIRPLQASIDTVYIWYKEESVDSPGQWNGNWFRIVINVTDVEYSVPTIIEEPEFTRGLNNTVYWNPASGARIQDAYCFDIEDRENLKKSVQRIYKYNETGEHQSLFEGLLNGHTYGFFVKAVHEIGNGTVSLYSDIVYSTQDNTPPSDVDQIFARYIDSERVIKVSWMSVNDSISGVAFYRIYRSSDPEGEPVLIDSVNAQNFMQQNLSWNDPNVVSNTTYYYRVCGVDSVGNQGKGIWTSGVYVRAGGGQSSGDEDDGDGDDDSSSEALESIYIKGSIDTLWIELDGSELWLRFESVRDDSSFFASKPQIGMRYFDSGWITPKSLRNKGWVSLQNPDSVFYIFNYADYENNSVDLNFVNGHKYIRAVTKVCPAADTVLVYLGNVVSDCFPPSDIRNLKIESMIDDPERESGWHFKLTWEPSSDGVSGLKRYHIFRKINGKDQSFVEISKSIVITDNFYIDSTVYKSEGISNPVVSYLVVAEDFTGNIRSPDETDWQVEERALGAPFISFSQADPQEVYPDDCAGRDTIFTKNESVSIDIKNFITSAVYRYIVSVNGEETILLPSGTELNVTLSGDEISKIKVRADYHGKPRSVWSNTKTVIRALNTPPTAVTAHNNPDYWRGDIHLRWNRSSLDVDHYEVWRSEGGEYYLVDDSVSSFDSEVQWTDYYHLNELSGALGDTMVAYRRYSYRVRAVNIFNDRSDFSSSSSSYCNRPPMIVSNDNPEIEDSRFVLTVHWRRVYPTIVEDGFQVIVKVSEDSLENVIKTAIVVDDSTYQFHGARGGHNYIFQVKEIPNEYGDRPSSWSKPYTVSSLVSLTPFTVLPQPKGKIYVNWDNPTIIEKFKVDSFMICRNDYCWSVPNTVIDFMDSSEVLIHKNEYEYNVFAIDSLGQVVAANAGKVMCDTGAAFIPEILDFTYKYFNSRSLEVSWVWRDIDGNALHDTTEGADSLIIQASISKSFPDYDTLTTTAGPFAADPSLKKRIIKVPELLNDENRILYFRITALDAWGHPARKYWSTDFYSQKSIIYDTILPDPVTDLRVVSSSSYYRNRDSVIVKLQWRDTTTLSSDRLLGNIDYYRVMRSYNNESIEVGTVAVDSGVADYSFTDTVRNSDYEWWIVSIDSAQNSETSEVVTSKYFVETPPPPIPTGFKSCMIQLIEADSVEYFVEIASNPDHFIVAYEIDDPNIKNRLLCQSGWLDADSFTCKSGWGSIVMDTTWFRVKARRFDGSESWESGWSSIIYYTEEDGSKPDVTGVDETGLPTVFRVFQNYPNPFNSSTVVSYEIPEASEVIVRVYNIMGASISTIFNGNQMAGKYSVVWDGRDDAGRPAASGIYFIHVVMKSERGEVSQKKLKVIMIK